MSTDRATQEILDRLDRASDYLAELKLTGNQARALNNHLYRLTEASLSKDAMAIELHKATEHANRMERQYLDIESGGVHFDLQAAREQLAEVKQQAAADKQRLNDLITELRKQVDWARTLRGRAEERRHDAEADNLAMIRQREAIRELHPRNQMTDVDDAATALEFCGHCVSDAWPCPTIAVLDGTTPKEET